MHEMPLVEPSRALAIVYMAVFARRVSNLGLPVLELSALPTGPPRLPFFLGGGGYNKDIRTKRYITKRSRIFLKSFYHKVLTFSIRMKITFTNFTKIFTMRHGVHLRVKGEEL